MNTTLPPKGGKKIIHGQSGKKSYNDDIDVLIFAVIKYDQKTFPVL